MKLSIFNILSLVLCILAASVTAVPQLDEKALIDAECDVPPIVAYCLDMIHLGSNYNSDGSLESAELQHDVDKVPMGMCAWGEWVGKLSAEECLQVLAEFFDEDDNGDEEKMAAADGDNGIEIRSTRFLKNIIPKKYREKISGAAKRVGNTVVKGVKHTVRKVSNFCWRNGKTCKKVVETGIKIIGGNNGRKTFIFGCQTGPCQHLRLKRSGQA